MNEKYTFKKTICKKQISFDNLRHIQYEPHKLSNLLNAQRIMEIIDDTKTTNKNLLKIKKIEDNIEILKLNREKRLEKIRFCRENITKHIHLIKILENLNIIK